MKLLPTKPLVKVDDSLGNGMDAVLLIAVFLGVGYGLDRWLGTTPWFTILLVVFASIGWFVRMRYTYEAQMLAHEKTRQEAHDDRPANAQPPGPSAPTSTAPTSTAPTSTVPTSGIGSEAST